MKREFKAPIIETMMLFATDSVMDDGILKSVAGPKTRSLTVWTDEDIKSDFNAWKGFSVK